MSNIDKRAYSVSQIIADLKLKHGSGDTYAPIMRWDELLALLDEMESKDKRIAEQADVIAKQEKWIRGIEEAMITATDRAEAAEKRIAELEAREVTLPAQKYCPGEYAGSVLWGETEVWNQAISECAKAIRAAGIGKGE